MNKYLAIAASIYWIGVNTAKTAGLIDEGQHWTLWYVGSGMCVMVLIDVATGLLRRRHARRSTDAASK